ncbi:MAG: amidohydrolase family protein [Planctomycetia bacterium]|nr:amidohydrolase family protein [Planctomycetia bacterium]
MQLVARRFDTRQCVELSVEEGRIRRLAPHGPADGTSAPFVAPGFCDIQVNGYGGQEFSSPELSADRVAEIVRLHARFGVTSLCPTLTTAAADVMEHGVRAIGAACDRWPDVARRVAGIHLEGPFISREDGPRGAHPAEHCRRPEMALFQRLQEASGGRVRLVTLSVEFDEAPPFISQVASTGVVVAIGHTGADSRQIRAAVDAGARLSTHLGNGAHGTLRRHPNYLWDQMAEDRLWASLIVDGQHLPPEVVKTMVRAKTPARCVLVSDVSGLAGLPPGRYQSSGCELEILVDGRLVIAGQDQLLAGASRPIGVGVANVMRFAGVDLATAVAMATTQPRKLLGLDAPQLKPGERADLVLFDLADGELRVRSTIVDGRVEYGHV